MHMSIYEIPSIEAIGYSFVVGSSGGKFVIHDVEDNALTYVDISNGDIFPQNKFTKTPYL